MMQNHHWAHQEPPASDDFFSPGVKWERRHRPPTGVRNEDADLAAVTGAALPMSPVKVHRVQQDPSQTIAKWLTKDHELAQAKLKEWVEKKQRELLSASPRARHDQTEVAPIPKARKRPSVPTTPKKPAHPSLIIPLVSPPSSARHRVLPSTAPTTPSKPPVTSPKPPKTPVHDPAESQAAYVEWLKRKSAELDRAAIERARQDSERAALRAAANALAKQRYDEWKATRKAPPAPARPKLHQFPMLPAATSGLDEKREPRVTFADVFGDIAFNPGNISGSTEPNSQHSSSARPISNHPRLAFGRPISTTASTVASPTKRAISTASHPHHHLPHNPPDLLSPPGMFAELERMQRHYPAYLKRFPGHVAHAGASVGKVWIDPGESTREQAAAAAKWARLNSAVGCYCHGLEQGKSGAGEDMKGQGHDVHHVEEVVADQDKKDAHGARC